MGQSLRWQIQWYYATPLCVWQIFIVMVLQNQFKQLILIIKPWPNHVQIMSSLTHCARLGCGIQSPSEDKYSISLQR